MVSLSDIATFFSSVQGFLAVILPIIVAGIGWLYREVRLKPGVELKLEPVISPDSFAASFSEEARNAPDLKTQPLRIRAKRRPIHGCKVKISFTNIAEYLVWNGSRESIDMVAEEEVLVTVWDAWRAANGEFFRLNITRNTLVNMLRFPGQVDIEISLLSREGRLKKKKYRIFANSYDTIRTEDLSWRKKLFKPQA